MGLTPDQSDIQIEMPATEKPSKKQLNVASPAQCIQCIVTDVNYGDVEPFKEQAIPVDVLIAGVTHHNL